jgi:hypothetical protein
MMQVDSACLPREARFLGNGCAYALEEFGGVCCFERGRLAGRWGVGVICVCVVAGAGVFWVLDVRTCR